MVIGLSHGSSSSSSIFECRCCLNVADPLGPRSRGGCRSCAAEAAGASGVTTVLLSLVTIVAVLRGFCRCCRAGATMQDLLLQLGMQKAPERISVLEESHPGVH